MAPHLLNTFKTVYLFHFSLQAKDQHIKELNLKIASLETAEESKDNNDRLKTLETENEEMKETIKKCDESIAKLKDKNNVSVTLKFYAATFKAII